MKFALSVCSALKIDAGSLFINGRIAKKAEAGENKTPSIEEEILKRFSAAGDGDKKKIAGFIEDLLK